MIRNLKLQKWYSAFHWVARITILVATLLVVYVFFFSQNDDNILKVGELYQGDEIWRIDGESYNAEKSGYNIKASKGEPVLLESIVPEKVEDDWGVMLLTDYCAVKVYVEDQLIDTYGYDESLTIDKMVGNIRMITSLSSDMKGDRIIVVYTPVRNTTINILRPQYGIRSELVNSIVKGNIFRIILCSGLAIFLLISLSLFIYQKKNNISSEYGLISNFVLLSFFSFVWLLNDSDLPQLFTNYSEGVILILLLAMVSVPIPFNGLCGDIFPKGNSFFRILWCVGWLNPIIIMVGYVFGVFNPVSMILIYHIYLAVSLAFSLFFAIKSLKDSVENLYMLIGIVVLIIASIGGLTCYYTNPNSGYNGIHYGMGFLFFFLITLIVIVRRQFEQISEKKFRDAYTDVAYTDGLTNLDNRFSIESRFSSLTEETSKGRIFTLIIFDMDDFHQVNDNLGHEAGDRQLIDMAQAIQSIFEQYGTCYRIAADEMAVVMIDMDGQEEGLLRDFDNAIRKYNENTKTPMNISYGYDTREYLSSQFFYRNLYKNAYGNMRMMKAKLASDSESDEPFGKSMLLRKIDSGTKLFDKGTIINYTMELINSAPNEHISIAIIDLDDFKTINDTYGHAFGDEVLTDAANIILEAVGNNGMCGRIGGDEMFIVFRHDGSEEGIRNVLRTIKTDIGYLYQNDNRNIQKISCSIGSAMYPDDARTYDELFKIADKMLYLAKEKGKNRYIYYIDEIHHDYVSGTKAESNSVSGVNGISKYHKVSVVTEFVNNYYKADILAKHNYLNQIAEEYYLDSIFIYDLVKGVRRVIFGKASLEENGECLKEDSVLSCYREDSILPVNSIIHMERKCPNFFKTYRDMGITQLIQYRNSGSEKLTTRIISYNRYKTQKQWAEIDLNQLAILGSMILDDETFL